MVAPFELKICSETLRLMIFQLGTEPRPFAAGAAVKACCTDQKESPDGRAGPSLSGTANWHFQQYRLSAPKPGLGRLISSIARSARTSWKCRAKRPKKPNRVIGTVCFWNRLDMTASVGLDK
jgi:hypothetical protein